MVTYDKQDKNLTIPSSLGNFSKAGGGSGSGMTPEEVQGMIDTSIEEYDTEIQVDIESLSDRISGNTEDIATISGTTGALGEMVASLSAKTKETFYFDVASYFAMGYDDRRDYFDLVYAKVEQGAEIFALGVAEGDNQTVRIPLIKYKAETDPSTHTGGWLYFSAKAPQYNNNSNLYFSFSTSSVGNISGLNSSGLFASQTIYTLPSSVTDGIDALSASTSALTENLNALSGNVETLSDSLSGYTTTDTFNAGISGLTGQISGVSVDVEELSGVTQEVYDAIFYEEEGETYSQIDDLWGALGDKQGTLLFQSGLTEVEGTVRVVPGHALKIGESGRLEINFGKGVQYSGDDELELNIGEGLGFSGDTLVVSGGSSNTKVVMLNKLSQQERLDLYNELSSLYDYGASGWSSAYTEDMYAFYLDLRSYADQDLAQTADQYEGFYPMECCRMHPTDYGGAAFFTGVEQAREGNGNLICIRFVIDYEGNADGPSTWWNRPPGGIPSIAAITFGNDERGYLVYDVSNDDFIYDNGTFTTGDTSNYVEDLVDWNYLNALFNRNGKFDDTYLINVHTFGVLDNGETTYYSCPSISRKPITNYTIGDYTFEYEVTFKYTDWELKVDIAEGNKGANVRISAV